MPLPMSRQEMSPPLNVAEIQNAVEAALVQSNVIPANESAKQILDSCGASLEQALVGLSNLSLTAKDNVKHAAIKDILDIHGVRFRQDVEQDAKPVITFNIQSEKTQVNMNSLFAPQRG
jgi:hypothetical protein